MNQLAPESPWETFQRIADARQPSQASSTPGYLEEFRGRWQAIVELLEVGMTADLEARGPSDDLMHDWSLVVAQAQDFLASIADEIERASG